jgi:hypothetical protein
MIGDALVGANAIKRIEESSKHQTANLFASGVVVNADCGEKSLTPALSQPSPT